MNLLNNGLLISFFGLVTVFIGLCIISIFLFLVSKITQKNRKLINIFFKKKQKMQISKEVSVAIATAIYLYKSIHEEQSLNIVKKQQTSNAFFPWRVK